jgi:hypothetical protein
LERTTNLSLKKPGLDDDALISDLNENFDKLDSKVGPVGNTSLQSQITAQSDNIAKVQNGLAYIVGDTNTTGGTLAVGAFVYVTGHSTIAEGLRKVTASISANGSITTNNTKPCSEGGLNALNSNFPEQFNMVYVDDRNSAATDAHICEIILNNARNAGTTIIIVRFANGQFYAFLTSNSFGYLEALRISYYNGDALIKYKYGSNNKVWSKTVFAGTTTQIT